MRAAMVRSYGPPELIQVEEVPVPEIGSGTALVEVHAAAVNFPDVLIVASRLKQYIHGRSGFSTSDRVLDPLSDIVRRVCDEAIENAAREGRKTVLDRDIRVG